ncbi:MAG: methionine--tRNA ligase subunit beta, partial [Bryobacterales bacterium]|nr:methionine--tRNA ligase subunit beta [Bryobacterales bacterium]
QYRGGVIPEAKQGGADQIANIGRATAAAALDAFERLDFSKALETIWALIAAVDKYIVEQAPWKLAKSQDQVDAAALNETLYTAAEALRIVTALLYPVIPESTARIWRQLGFDDPIEKVRIADLHWGHLPAGQQLKAVEGVFPRAELNASIMKMRDYEQEDLARQQALLGKQPTAATTAAASNGGPQITIDDFAKVDLRVGLVKSAVAIKGANKLLHLQVDIGEPQPRSIVAGIAEAYEPGALVGRKVVIVANLAPRKLRGLESQGMIVAASIGNGTPVLAGFLEDAPVGARLK